MRTISQLHIADLAQLVEHLICNQRVSGSNPLIGMGISTSALGDNIPSSLLGKYIVTI